MGVSNPSAASPPSPRAQGEQNLGHKKLLMQDFDCIWSKRLENERKVSTLYQERSQLLEEELLLTRNLLRKVNLEAQVSQEQVYTLTLIDQYF